jgi:carbon-monoxide dehydrogenase large subunit
VIGYPVQRLEDEPLLRGQARYVADLVVPGTVHAVFVRSPLAHARVRDLRVDEAAKAPGVLGVFGAEDLGLGGLDEWPPPPGGPRAALRRPCLARDRVRFVGEALAVVVAETESQAVDAAELVELDLEELPAAVDPVAAAAEDAPVLFEELGSNVARREVVSTGGDPLEGAEVVVSARLVDQRVAAVPLEPNGTLAVPEDDGGLTLWVSAQAPFQVRAAVAGLLGLAPEAVRVRVPAVGGGFGAKGGAYPEQVVVAALARRLRRPVRHVETRSENLVAMSHGRGQVQEVALGATRDGRLVGLRARTLTDMGAYPWRGGIPFRTALLMAAGPYRVPNLTVEALGVLTPTTPIGPYRGAGRPEAALMWERAMDLLALELGLDPAELRRRNLLRPDELPRQTPSGAAYDSGDYPGALDAVLALADYEGLREEQARRRRERARWQLGIGLACFVEVSGTGEEYGALRVTPAGTVELVTGSSPHGQGHATTFAQVVAATMGVPLEQVRLVASDTGLVPRGTGTFGSRSGQLGGGAAKLAADEVLAKAKALAAARLEAAVEDIEVAEGRLQVAGVPARSLEWAELAALAEGPEGRALLGPEGLFAEADAAQPEGTYPNGAHLAVCEVDLETGLARVTRLVAVDDCGTVINPRIVAGQVHGGLAQGIAQALYEEVRFDESGQPLGTTLAEYRVPSAAELPSFETAEHPVPTPRNPLGAKGVGESGTVGATPAVVNAVLDALAPYGVRHLDPPLSPERIWQALRAAARP